MRAVAGIFILLGIFLLIGTVSADMADSASSISTSKEWLVANNYDASVISVVAMNSINRELYSWRNGDLHC